MVDKRWFPFGFGPVLAGQRLFCLPFAGGSASFFHTWRKTLADVGVAPVQYPGRETRFQEPCRRVLTELVDELAQAMLPHLDRPYAILGYSLGARVGFALCHKLAALGAPKPALFIPVAHHAPDAPVRAGVAGLPEDEFCRHVLAYGGMPESVLRDPEMLAMLLPILRADIGLVEQPLPQQPIDCPILACAGSADAAATPSGMAEWRRYTTAEFSARTFEGGHFFARTASDFLPALAGDIGLMAKDGAGSKHSEEAVFS